MRCEECDGFGWFMSSIDFGPLGPGLLPCPYCGQTGIVHCCEGNRVQPEERVDAN